MHRVTSSTRSVGRLAADAHLDLLVVVGTGASPLAAAARERGLVDVIETADAAAALEAMQRRVGVGDAVLVKGSRAVGLDLVVRALTAPEPRSRSGTEPAP